jgi:Ca2+-binding EF-hand superfamily protein/RIO-like serine/threonine protein kinase
MATPGSPTIDFDKLVIEDFSEIESEQFKKEVVIPYFKDIYRDLASRSDKKSSGINKVTIIDYCSLPGILAERFFSLLDANNDEYIDLKEFVYILFKIYYSNFDNQVKLVFDIYDFDKDGYITKEDVRIILSYVPMLKNEESKSEKEGAFSQEGGGDEDFNSRIRIQEEISELLDLSFGKKDKLNLEDFQKINEDVTSDMLVTVLQLLRDKLPCSETFYKYQREFEAKNENKSTKTGGTKKTKTIASPRILKSLSPLARDANGGDFGDSNESMSFLRKLAKGEQATEGDAKGIDEKDIQLDKIGKNKKRQNAELSVKELNDPESPGANNEVVRLSNANPEPKSLLEKSKPKNIFASPTSFLGGSGAEREELETSSGTSDKVQYEGEMMRKAKENKLKKYWHKLYDKELRIYKHKDDKDHKTMVNLISVFIRIEPEEKLDKNNTLFPFTLLFPNKERTYYLLQSKYRDEWVSQIKIAIGYASLTDFYEVKDPIGKGKFGTVKLGIHKKTGKKVAIKVMKKKQMTLQDIELQKREIEILKICQHPSIIKLLDVFENQDYIYIVMEYLKGGDLFNYLEKRDFTISESRARDLTHSMAVGIFYLHSFGIAHRDLKPENILMTDESDDAQPKLVDFGLSKIVGPSEKCHDPFGTLSYVAPEVLLQKPYDKGVDLWSLGVIIYLLMSGTLPFDDDDDREIARQTIHDEVDFSYHVWKKVSTDTKNMIKSLLDKDKDKRMTLEEVLQHPWILKKSKSIASQRKKSGDSAAADKFKAFAMTEEVQKEIEDSKK